MRNQIRCKQFQARFWLSSVEFITITSESSVLRICTTPLFVQTYLKFNVLLRSWAAAKRDRFFLFKCSFTYTSLSRNLNCLLASDFLAVRTSYFVFRLINLTTGQVYCPGAGFLEGGRCQYLLDEWVLKGL